MKLIAIITLFFVLGACANKRPQGTKELLSYINDEKNGLKQVQEKGSLKTTVCYKPLDLVMENDLKRLSPAGQDSMKEQLKHAAYFNVNVSKEQKDLTADVHSFYFEQMLKNFNPRADKSIYLLLDKQDTVFVADYVYPRLYGSTGNTALMVVFKDERIYQSKNIAFNWKNMETSPFVFETEKLKAIN